MKRDILKALEEAWVLGWYDNAKGKSSRTHMEDAAKEAFRNLLKKWGMEEKAQ